LSVIIFAVLPHVFGSNFISVLYLAFFYICLAQSWNLLAGYGGLISLGHAAFFGLGAYATAMIVNSSGLAFPIAILCGGLTACIFSLVISMVLLRLNGIYFAMGSLAISEIVRILVKNLTGSGESGALSIHLESGISQTTFYYFTLVIAICATAIPWFLLQTRLGLGLRALRDRESSARNMGVAVFKTRLYAFVISAFIAGLLGGIHALETTEIDPDSVFNVILVFSMASMVIIGGGGTIFGPIIGSFLILVLWGLFSDFQSWYLVITGTLLIVVIRFFPDGIWGKILSFYGMNGIPDRSTDQGSSFRG
jgi:branched-chain amino acid transport system permease protein